MLRSLAALGFTILMSAPTVARVNQALPSWAPRLADRSPTVLFFDDVESGENGWTHVDNTATAEPRFHVDTYMAYSGSSWWCGTFDYDANGGYGNSWDDRLSLPPVDWTGSTEPVLTFVYRCDSEPGYDLTYVQAESSGVFVSLNSGYDGTTPWSDVGVYGFLIAEYDSPFVGRFRFLSDGSASDEDGNYESDGGAFMCDNIQVFDFYTSEVFFFDDVETGGLCVPSVGVPGGDWWHIIDRPCPAYSDVHSWWCGDDADTGLIPPNLNNSLVSPPIDIVGVAAGTLRFRLHSEVPMGEGDMWKGEVSTDGGTSWHVLGFWWGDFGTCDGWVSHGTEGIDLGPYLPGSELRFRVTFFTTDDGCGPGAAGGAGIMLDDVLVEDWTFDPAYACCHDDTCESMTSSDCLAAGGTWTPGVTSCSPNPCLSSVHVVRPDGTGDFATIQDAIDAASPGDTILLTDGVFTGEGNRDLNYLGVSITIQSQSDDPRTCIIDAEQQGRGLTFDSGEDSTAVLRGVTIRNGVAGDWGGAVRCRNGSSPTLRNCIFADNSAGNSGGALGAENASPSISFCTFVGNRCSLVGPGAVACSGEPAPIIGNCTFWGNESATSDPCIVNSGGSTLAIDNTIIASTTQGAAVGGVADLTCSNLWGNADGDWVGDIAGQYGVDGNISEDPLFCDADGGDFLLYNDSPCAFEHNPSCGLIGAWDVGCTHVARACCFEESCAVMTEAHCAAAGGSWQEWSASCDPNPCGPQVFTVEADGTGDFPTIQEAVWSASAGDTIELADGTFRGDGNRDVVGFPSWPLMVRSQSGNPADCVIDCEGTQSEPHRGFHFNLTSLGTALEGIKIVNGYAPNGEGGAVLVDAANVALANCIFSDNTAGSGGGILTQGPGFEATLTDCVFENNNAGLGGAAFCRTSATFLNCVFVGSSAAMGAALYCETTDQISVTNCTFHGNAAAVDELPCISSTLGPVVVTNSIIAFTAPGLPILGPAELSCCNVYGNDGGDWVGDIANQYGINGNISAHPLFCAPWDGDLTLGDASPCAPENNPACGLIGASPVGCASAAFAAEPLFGQAPLSVQFTDLTPGNPTGWEWDFQYDGAADDTTQNPVFEYADPGFYTVGLDAFVDGELLAYVVRERHIWVHGDNNMIVRATEITSPEPTGVPIQFVGSDSLGAVSLFFDYDDASLTFSGVETYVPGEIFSAGVVGDQISVQWFDETGGDDPIVPGVDPDTLFAILFTSDVSADTTQVLFDESDCLLANRFGDPLPDVSWMDEFPFGMVYINVGARVFGRVGYYWLDGPVPNARLSMGPPNPDVWTDGQGDYEFARYPYGSYVLHIDKSDDLGGINSLDALKVIRHSTGVEPLGDPHKEIAADVNGIPGINALDAIKIVRAAVGLEDLPSGDWTFDPDSLTFAPLETDVEADFIAVRMGDVDGNWAPDSRSRFVGRRQSDVSHLPARGAREPVTLTFPSTTLPIANDPSRMPLVVTDFDGIGAISLRLTFDDALLEYADVASEVPGASFTTNLVGNEIRIEWFDATGGANPISIGSDTLLTVGFALVGTEGDSSLVHFADDCALGDAAGDPIAGVMYADGYARLSGGSTGTEEDLPAEFRVSHNFPNPFNPMTTIAYELPAPARVSLTLYDIAGRHVRTLLDRTPLGAGRHEVLWDGRDDEGRSVASGVYLYRVEAGGEVDVRKMILLK